MTKADKTSPQSTRAKLDQADRCSLVEARLAGKRSTDSPVGVDKHKDDENDSPPFSPDSLPLKFSPKNELNFTSIDLYRMRYRDYKKTSARNNRVFNLSIDEFYSLVTTNCFYCLAEPTLKKSRYGNARPNCKPILINGIDRLDSSLGYHLSNCVPCCFVCNRAKGNLPLSQFISWIRVISSHLKVIETLDINTQSSSEDLSDIAADGSTSLAGDISSG